MVSRRHIARGLAATLLAGPWEQTAAELRAAAYLGKSDKRSLKRLVADVIHKGAAGYPLSPKALVDRLLRSAYFDRTTASAAKAKMPPAVVLDPPVFAPTPIFAELGHPRIETVGDLATWLDVPVTRLDWLADDKRQLGQTDIPILRHYNYHFVPKSSGGPPRLIEAPKAQLKALQRRILAEIVDLAPAHPDAHGFVRDRSCLTGAHVHAGEYVVVSADLRDFFPSIRAARVHGLFRSFGYPHMVARALTGLCTTSTPQSVFERVEANQRHDWLTRKMFNAPHLAQGAPTSPSLANLCAWRFDQRSAGLARALGGRYTRYADDLTFSGDQAFAERVRSLIAAVGEIAAEEGFALNHTKTRVMRRSKPQRVTGVIVNDHINIERTEYDALKATLHNCRLYGPISQNKTEHPNFQSHLDGRVRWVEQVNPKRGAKLRMEFEMIRWT